MCGEDGEDEVGIGAGIAVDDGLHARLDPDHDALSRLVALIGNHAAADVRPAQVGGIDEGHALGIEAEQEDVAGQGQRRVLPERQTAQAADVGIGHRPLLRPDLSGVESLERSGINGMALPQHLIIYSAQRLDVAHRGVQAHALLPQPLHIGGHAVGGDVGKRQRRTAGEPAEGADGGTIVFGSAELLLLLALGGLTLGTTEEAGARPLSHTPGERQTEMTEAKGKMK